MQTTPSAIVLAMRRSRRGRRPRSTLLFVAQLFAGSGRAALLGALLPFFWLRQSAAAAEAVRGTVPGGARPAVARHSRRPRLPDRDRHGRRRNAGAGRPEFKKTFDQQNFGLPLRDALNELAERVPLLDVRFFVTAVPIQRETGGNLSEILDNLAHVVRERFKIQRQVRVHTAHGRFTGYVLLALPAFLAVALSFINPEHMKPALPGARWARRC